MNHHFFFFFSTVIDDRCDKFFNFQLSQLLHLEFYPGWSIRGHPSTGMNLLLLRVVAFFIFDFDEKTPQKLVILLDQQARQHIGILDISDITSGASWIYRSRWFWGLLEGQELLLSAYKASVSSQCAELVIGTSDPVVSEKVLLGYFNSMSLV